MATFAYHSIENSDHLDEKDFYHIFLFLVNSPNIFAGDC